VNVYWFDLKVAGPVTDGHIEALAERMAGHGGIDATVQADERGGVVMFSREADDAVQAIVSAVSDVEAVGISVTGVNEDDVTVEEIAERAGVTVTAVRYWISGARGPGGFPTARVVRQRGSTYSWAEVSSWMAMARVGRVDYLAAETARAVALIADALSVRQGIRELPKHNRPLVSRLVA
jgi:predicted transcriptional regulator